MALKASSALDEEQTAYLRGVGVEAPVEVARKPDHSGKGVDGQRCAAQDAADRNWLMLHTMICSWRGHNTISRYAACAVTNGRSLMRTIKPLIFGKPAAGGQRRLRGRRMSTCACCKLD